MECMICKRDFEHLESERAAVCSLCHRQYVRDYKKWVPPASEFVEFLKNYLLTYRSDTVEILRLIDAAYHRFVETGIKGGKNDKHYQARRGISDNT